MARAPNTADGEGHKYWFKVDEEDDVVPCWMASEVSGGMDGCVLPCGHDGPHFVPALPKRRSSAPAAYQAAPAPPPKVARERAERAAAEAAAAREAAGGDCLLYTSPSPRDRTRSRMPSSA